MQERMKGLLTIFSAGFLFIFLPALFISLHRAPIDIYTQSIAGVTTPAGQYAANVTLSIPLYYSSILNVESVSSNISGDYPSASYYNPTGNKLELTGLAENAGRTLTIEYGVESDINNDLPALSSVLVTVAWLFIFAGIALLVAGILTIFKVI